MAGDDFVLSASLNGHEKDVRAVCYPIPDSVFTASRDCTVQAWHGSSRSPPDFAGSLLVQGSYSFNSVAFLPASDNRPEHPKGLVLAGSYDHTIEVRKPDVDLTQNRVCLLSGHTSNVSALSVSPNGEFVVSGDWDGRVKLWNTSTWKHELELIGPNLDDKQRAIWDVLAYSNTIVITGSADNVIRGYSLQNKREKEGELEPGVFIRTPDVVRALCRVRKHPTAAQIASAGNDFLIRLWQFNGSQVGVLHGHESFIYALDSLPTGELVSSSEDRTVRIWKGETCIQTITHPALSIWSVSVCQETGDFATGASDNVARIFTRHKERMASAETLKQFSDTVQQSAIPQQQVGDVNPSTLPGPEFIETKQGTKDGQTVMINSGGGNVSVYQWSVGQHEWLLVGTVVDSSAQEAEAAPVFGLAQESPTISLGGPGQHGEARDGASEYSLGPHSVFVTLAQSNFKPILNRINTVNSKLPDNLSLTSAALGDIESLTSALSKELPSVSTTVPANVPAVPVKEIGLDPAWLTAVLKLVTAWPYKDRLPGLDILRCAGLSAMAADFRDEQGNSLLDIIIPGILGFSRTGSDGVPEDTRSVENNAMMALRFLTNLFVTDPGQKLISSKSSLIVDFLEKIVTICGNQNRNLMVAWTSAVSNIMSFSLREQEASGVNSFGKDSLSHIAGLLSGPINESKDSEVLFRALIAAGNFASIPGDGGYTQTARDLGVGSWVKAAVTRASEARVQSVGDAILKKL